MKDKLSYIEENMKGLMDLFPHYYDHILSGEELSDFIFMLMKDYSSSANRDMIISESNALIAGDFFLANKDAIISNQLSETQKKIYQDSFSRQNEDSFLETDFDISHSRMIRYMPAQWHLGSYFFIYFAQKGDCKIHFRSKEVLTMKKGNILILAPFVEHATPCYDDDALLEYFLVRASSFEKVFWDQLNKDSIMSHFFRNALKNEERSSVSYLLFDTGNDEEIAHVISQIKCEIAEKLPYSSSLINALTSILFSLMLRRYGDSVLLPANENGKWKKEYSRIFSYIQDHFTDSSLDDVSKACGYSQKQISRIVSVYFNMNYSELITFLKMDRAVTLLKQGMTPIEEISSSLGYSDMPSFYRAFKKYYRTTPGEYLKQINELS